MSNARACGMCSRGSRLVAEARRCSTSQDCRRCQGGRPSARAWLVYTHRFGRRIVLELHGLQPAVGRRLVSEGVVRGIETAVGSRSLDACVEKRQLNHSERGLARCPPPQMGCTVLQCAQPLTDCLWWARHGTTATASVGRLRPRLAAELQLLRSGAGSTIAKLQGRT